MKAEIYQGECIETMRSFDDESFDSVITDPPYALPGGFMGRDWDHFKTPKAFQEWCEAWGEECLRVLRPGGHILSFGGTRAFHRMASGLEDAGFNIRDCISWFYVQGYPKSIDVSKAIDKHLGANRKVRKVVVKRTSGKGSWAKLVGGGRHKEGEQQIKITDPATAEAKQWDGWGSGLKPAWEPIVVGRKKLSEKTVAANVLLHGTGGINVKGCRIGVDIVRTHGKRKKGGSVYLLKDYESPEDFEGLEYIGRWPANVVLSCECEEEHSPDCPVKLIDAQGGTAKGDGNVDFQLSGKNTRAFGVFGMGKGLPAGRVTPSPKDSGGISRILYCAKVSTSERNAERNPGIGSVDNLHVSVKPLKLMAWLCRLVTPPGGRILDPFLGSGSTMIAALREGFECIGIEQDPDYAKTALERVKLDSPLFNDQVALRTSRVRLPKRVRL